MEIPEKLQEAQSEARFAYLGFMDTVYQMPLWQRWLLVASLVCLVFGFLVSRSLTDWVFTLAHKDDLVVATESFTNPQDLRVGKTGLVPLSEGGVLAYAELENPNLSLSARNIAYTFLLQDSSGATVGRSSGQTFLLPGQSRLVASSRVTTFGQPTRASLEINKVSFQKRLSIPEVDLQVADTQVLGGGQNKRLEGKVTNVSAYVLGSVELVVRLDRRSTGELVAVFTRQEQSLVPRVERAFVIPWPDLPEDDLRVSVAAYTNVLDARNISIQKGGSGGLR